MIIRFVFSKRIFACRMKNWEKRRWEIETREEDVPVLQEWLGLDTDKADGERVRIKLFRATEES